MVASTVDVVATYVGVLVVSSHSSEEVVVAAYAGVLVVSSHSSEEGGVAAPQSPVDSSHPEEPEPEPEPDPLPDAGDEVVAAGVEVVAT